MLWIKSINECSTLLDFMALVIEWLHSLNLDEFYILIILVYFANIHHLFDHLASQLFHLLHYLQLLLVVISTRTEYNKLRVILSCSAFHLNESLGTYNLVQAYNIVTHWNVDAFLSNWCWYKDIQFRRSESLKNIFLLLEIHSIFK